MQDRLDRMPEAMGVRRQTVEHPFGTLKALDGRHPLLTRTLDKVRTEISLHVLAYNLKRMITIFGVGPLMRRSEPDRLAQAMRASRFTGPSTAMAAKHSASPTSHRAFFHGLGRQRDYDGTFDWIPRATRPKLGMGPVVPQIGANFETWSGEHTVYVINDNNGSLFLFEQLSGETWMTRDAISKVSPNWNPGGAGAPDPRALAAINAGPMS